MKSSAENIWNKKIPIQLFLLKIIVRTGAKSPCAAHIAAKASGPIFEEKYKKIVRKKQQRYASG